MKNKSNEKDFVPEKEISIDAEHMLEQASGKFQSVKDGLPELIKNSKDHYSRLKVTNKEDRQIVIVISKDKKNLGVLDFAGAALEDFTGWKTWSSRIANRSHLAEDIEGGHGNGGKFFMVRGCKERASMCGHINNKINKWGFVNNDPSIHFRAGIFKNKEGIEIKNLKEDNVTKVLNSEIKNFGLELSQLPKAAQEIFEKRKSFTFVNLMNVKAWENLNESTKMRIIRNISLDLMEHAQSSLTIETCTVWIMIGDKLLYPLPLEVSDLQPFEGLENIPETIIPENLIDPETEEKINLNFKDKNKNVLIIKTSKKDLRLSDRLKPRNVIRIRNKKNIVANWLLPDLVPLASSAFIYGTLTCELLEKEQLSGTEWLILADTPLSRALKHWTSSKVIEIAREIQKIQSSKNTEEERDSTSETLKKLRDLMNEFLNKETENGENGNGENGTGKGKKKKRKMGDKIDGIILEPFGKILKMGEGSTIPLVYWCYENKDGKKLLVKNVHLILEVEKPEIIDWVDEYSIKGIKEGSTKINFQTQDGKIKSNQIEIVVKKIKNLTISPIQKILKQGETIKLDINVLDKGNNKINDLIYEAHIDEIGMGKVNRLGFFTAGGIEGNATVRIIYGIGDNDETIIILQIGNEKIPGHEGGSKGKGAPLILLCGNTAPGREEFPLESRTLIGGEDYPTVIDYDPLWEGIIWINHNSLESKKVRGREEGGTMKINCRTFRQFLALKCFEILKRLKVEEYFGNENKGMTEFRQALAQAEMETSGFLDKSYDLVIQLIEEGEEDE